ncbi:MAG TPA: Uma2 family endonuclease [Candidatus Baltobacteraceae bacterium]|jgi:Uma2 family endonuclease|nr:Uma2 family endonuclease [Candidatus Baltobacteraceae bacterium]
MELPDHRHLELPDHRLTLEEYLKLEAISTEPLEYIDGFASVRTRPSKGHEKIAGNLIMTLGPIVRSNGCDFFANGAKVITKIGYRTIPDFVVTCDKRDLDQPDDDEAIIEHPWLVIEILSPSTMADDNNRKLFGYQSIEELTHYVLIDSRLRSMRLYERLPDGNFLTPPAPLERLILPTLGEHGVSIDEVYRNTKVPLIQEVRSPRI